MTALDLAIELSDLYEAIGAEGGLVATLIDEHIMTIMRKPLNEVDGAGLGDKFGEIIDKVRAQVQQSGSDSIRNLAQMMKLTLTNYAKKTHDASTARNIYHKAIMGGGDKMLTVTAAGMIANAIAGQHSQQAILLMQKIAHRLGGPQIQENSSGAAVSAGAIATIPMGKKKKKRPDSIFAEDVTSLGKREEPVKNPSLEDADDVSNVIAPYFHKDDKPVERRMAKESMSWNDIQDLPATIDMMEQVVRRDRPQNIDGVIIDPTTAELVLSVHRAMLPTEKRDYEAKPMTEMIQIADQWVRDGLMSVIMEED